MADLAALHHVRTGFHGAEDMSPVSLAAGLHLGLDLPNFGIQEYAGHSADTEAVFPHAYRLDRGRLHPGSAPSHGVDLDEAAARFPYRRGYLPMARLEDGTRWNW